MRKDDAHLKAVALNNMNPAANAVGSTRPASNANGEQQEQIPRIELENTKQFHISEDLDMLTHVSKLKETMGPRSKLLGDISYLPPLRIRVIEVVEATRTEMCLGLVILFNMVLLIVETDATSEDGDAPAWVIIANYVLLGVYVTELTVRFFAYHLQFFSDGWNVMDFLIIGFDIILVFLDLILGNMPRISVCRAFRLVRICRAFKALSMFPELDALLRSFMNAIKAILWGMTLILIVICVWSILAVQLIHPVNKDVTEEGVYLRMGCERCPHAFSTVFYSMLTLFQTLVAGDSWGQVALPIIEHYPPAGIFFLCALVTVSLAIMNLILAVIVERAQDSATENLAEQAEEKRKKFEEAALELLELCGQLDSDNSHCLSKQELLKGFDTKEFSDAMQVMGIRRGDMDVLFDVLDEDGSGDIKYVEFVDQLFKFRNPDMKTAIFELAKVQLRVDRIQHSEAQAMKKTEARNEELRKTLAAIKEQLTCVVPASLSRETPRGTSLIANL